MGKFLPGDVLLASVALDDRSVPKTRPVIVIAADASGTIRALPVSSRPPSDAPCTPLAIDDFAGGGLDLFSESYVMTSRVVVIQNSAVIGKKGRLFKESLAAIAGQVPENLFSCLQPDKKEMPGGQHR